MKRAAQRNLSLQESKFKVTLFQDKNFQPQKKLDGPYRFLMTGFISTIDEKKKDANGYPVQIKIPGINFALSMVDKQMYFEISQGVNGSQIIRVPCTLNKENIGTKLPDITSNESFDLSHLPKFAGLFTVSMWFTKSPKVATGYLNRTLNASNLKNQTNDNGLCMEDPKHPLHFLMDVMKTPCGSEKGDNEVEDEDDDMEAA
jgi:hypothetical protein